MTEQDNVLVTEFTFPSADGVTEIHAWRWEPKDVEPRGIVQIVHGMTEYIGRYDAFARYLCSRRFIVVGNDQLGHGSSVKDESEWGVYSVGRGREHLVADVETLRSMTRYVCGPLPYFILGHSMGSFTLRNYLARHGEGLAGAVVCGTGHLAAPLVGFGHALSCRLAKKHGPTHKSSFINNMGVGGYNKKFEPSRTSYDWLSKDEAIVDAYAADPRCTFMFSVSGYSELMGLIKGAIDRSTFRKTPNNLPILVVSGADDPVGDFGKAPQTVYEFYKEAGVTDVTLKLYEGDRHEILNETDRDTVFFDISHWMEARRR